MIFRKQEENPSFSCSRKEPSIKDEAIAKSKKAKKNERRKRHYHFRSDKDFSALAESLPHVTGVRYARGGLYWSSDATTEGRRYCKYYSISRFGFLTAWAKALEHRKIMLQHPGTKYRRGKCGKATKHKPMKQAKIIPEAANIRESIQIAESTKRVKSVSSVDSADSVKANDAVEWLGYSCTQPKEVKPLRSEPGHIYFDKSCAREQQQQPIHPELYHKETPSSLMGSKMESKESSLLSNNPNAILASAKEASTIWSIPQVNSSGIEWQGSAKIPVPQQNFDLPCRPLQILPASIYYCSQQSIPSNQLLSNPFANDTSQQLLATTVSQQPHIDDLKEQSIVSSLSKHEQPYGNDHTKYNIAVHPFPEQPYISSFSDEPFGCAAPQLQLADHLADHPFVSSSSQTVFLPKMFSNEQPMNSILSPPPFLDSPTQLHPFTSAHYHPATFDNSCGQEHLPQHFPLLVGQSLVNAGRSDENCTDRIVVEGFASQPFHIQQPFNDYTWQQRAMHDPNQQHFHDNGSHHPSIGSSCPLHLTPFNGLYMLHCCVCKNFSPFSCGMHL